MIPQCSASASEDSEYRRKNCTKLSSIMESMKAYAKTFLLMLCLTACAVPSNSALPAKPLAVTSESASALPLDRAPERVTKKPFGIKVSPQNSPVQPEHFSGYHTGVDFEIFSDEQNKPVSISAICAGKILQKRTAQGYGGGLVESCVLKSQPVPVIYGHLKLSNIAHKIGDSLTVGERFALLGDAFSAETGGERKHLHLGIKKGAAVNIRGYVKSKSELDGWMDFEKLYQK